MINPILYDPYTKARSNDVVVEEPVEVKEEPKKTTKKTSKKKETKDENA